jgi:hypothetical protein
MSSRQSCRLMVAHWSCPVPQMCERKRCHLCPLASASSGRLPVEVSLNVGNSAASKMVWTESVTERQVAPKQQTKRHPPMINSSKYSWSYSSPASRVSVTVLIWLGLRLGIGLGAELARLEALYEGLDLGA